MIIKIDTAKPIKESSSVAKLPGGLSVVGITFGYPSTYVINTGYVNNLQEPNYSSWGLGTGYVVNVTGSKIFDETSFGASLEQLTIINRGPNNLRVMVNSSGFVLSQAVNLENDESIKMLGPIGNVWAASATGVCIVDGFGLPYINSRTI